MSFAIEDYRINFEDTIYGKGGLNNPKEFSHEKWTQFEYSIYKYSSSRENIHGVNLSCVII